MGTNVRAAFLSTADSTVRLLHDPAVGAAWARPSGLAGFSVGGLVAHLAQQVFAVAAVLDAPVPDRAPVGHFEPARWCGADESSLRIAGDGWAFLVARTAAAVAELRGMLAAQPDDRLVRVADRTLTLDDFLSTGLLELGVHADDIAVSADVPTPELTPDVLDLLLRRSVARHGPTAVLRALSRAERAPATISAL